MNIIELIKKIAPIAFSGIGVAIISFFFDLIIKKEGIIIQRIKMRTKI